MPTQLSERSKSQRQQQFMGMVYRCKKDPSSCGTMSPEVKKAAKSITKKDARDFAATKHKDLPEKVEESFIDRLNQALFEARNR